MQKLLCELGIIEVEKEKDKIMFHSEDNWFVIRGESRYCDTLFNCLRYLNAIVDAQIIESCLKTGFFGHYDYRICHEFWMQD